MQTVSHDVAGTVRIVDDKTLEIRNFVYDGEGPDAFFAVGVRTPTPNPNDATPIRLPRTSCFRGIHRVCTTHRREAKIPKQTYKNEIVSAETEPK